MPAMPSFGEGESAKLQEVRAHTARDHLARTWEKTPEGRKVFLYTRKDFLENKPVPSHLFPTTKYRGDAEDELPKKVSIERVEKTMDGAEGYVLQMKISSSKTTEKVEVMEAFRSFVQELDAADKKVLFTLPGLKDKKKTQKDQARRSVLNYSFPRSPCVRTYSCRTQAENYARVDRPRV